MKMFILAILLERRKEQKKLNLPISAKLAALLEMASHVLCTTYLLPFNLPFLSHGLSPSLSHISLLLPLFRFFKFSVKKSLPLSFHFLALLFFLFLFFFFSFLCFILVSISSKSKASKMLEVFLSFLLSLISSHLLRCVSSKASNDASSLWNEKGGFSHSWPSTFWPIVCLLSSLWQMSKVLSLYQSFNGTFLSSLLVHCLGHQNNAGAKIRRHPATVAECRWTRFWHYLAGIRPWLDIDRDPARYDWIRRSPAGSGQICLPESSNGDWTLPDSGDNCIFTFRANQTPKNIFEKIIFLKLILLKIFYDGNHFTSKQTKHKWKTTQHGYWPILVLCDMDIYVLGIKQRTTWQDRSPHAGSELGGNLIYYFYNCFK
jgi:hypothetical protein